MNMFVDRYLAGVELARHQSMPGFGENLVVLALPRGGVQVGYEIAKVLHAPLDVIVARKIGLPGNKEFGIGAISEGNVRIIDDRFVETQDVAPIRVNRTGLASLQEIIKEEKEEMQRRVGLYRNNKPLPDLKNKTVILVDDGLATGVTAKAAIQVIKKRKPKKIIFAAPVCAYETAEALRSLVDEVVCLARPFDLGAIGLWYRNFEQVSDGEVVELLKTFHPHGVIDTARKQGAFA